MISWEEFNFICYNIGNLKTSYMWNSTGISWYKNGNRNDGISSTRKEMMEYYMNAEYFLILK